MSLVIVGFLVNARWLHDWWNFRRLAGASHSTMRSKLHHKESLVNAIDQWLIIDWQSCETQPFAMTPQTLDIDNKDRQVEYKKSAISKVYVGLVKSAMQAKWFHVSVLRTFCVYLSNSPYLLVVPHHSPWISHSHSFRCRRFLRTEVSRERDAHDTDDDDSNGAVEINESGEVRHFTPYAYCMEVERNWNFAPNTSEENLEFPEIW